MPNKYELIICKVIGMYSLEDISRELEQYSTEEWKLLMNKLEYHQVIQPFFYYLRKAHLEDSFSNEWINLLTRNQLETISNNIKQYALFNKLINRLIEKSIQVIPLKGVYLADAIYAHIGVRPMGDIDLLVHERDIPEIDGAIREIGYKIRDYWLDAEKKVVHTLPPFTKDQAPDIDVHWAFTMPNSPFSIDYDGVWERTRPGVVSGVNVPILDPVDQLLSLSIHLSYHHHFLAGLRSLVDIKEYLQKLGESFPWAAAVDRATEWKCKRVLFLTLFLLQNYLKVQIPEEILSALRPEDFTSNVKHWASAQLFPTVTEEEAYISITLSEVWNRRGLWNKLRGSLNYLIPSREMISNKYGVSPKSPILYIYYIRRVTDLFSKHGKNIIRLFTGKKNTREKSIQNAEGFWIADWMAKG